MWRGQSANPDQRWALCQHAPKWPTDKHLIKHPCKQHTDKQSNRSIAEKRKMNEAVGSTHFLPRFFAPWTVSGAGSGCRPRPASSQRSIFTNRQGSSTSLLKLGQGGIKCPSCPQNTHFKGQLQKQFILYCIILNMTHGKGWSPPHWCGQLPYEGPWKGRPSTHASS